MHHRSHEWGGLRPGGPLSKGSLNGFFLSTGSLSRERVSVQGKGLCPGGSLSRGIGGSKGAPGTRTPLGVQILSFSCSFWQKNCKIIALLGVGAPSAGKSWIRYCRGSLSREVSVRETPAYCTVTSGWYASNWNAFLSVKYQQRLLEPATFRLRDKMLPHSTLGKQALYIDSNRFCGLRPQFPSAIYKHVPHKGSIHIWSTFVQVEKFNNVFCAHFFVIAWTEMFTQ